MKINQPNGDEGQIEQSQLLTTIPRPENYENPPYPRFEVQQIYSGANTFAPNTGHSYGFSKEQEAKLYIASLKELGFKGTVSLLKMEKPTGFNCGTVLKPEIRIA